LRSTIRVIRAASWSRVTASEGVAYLFVRLRAEPT